MSLPRFLLLSMLFLSLAWPVQAQEPELHRGLNLSSWLANAPRQPLFARDFAQIKAAGFDHVRLPFNPEYVGYKLTLQDSDPSQIDFSGLDRAVALAEQYDLPVILDLHTNSDFTDTLERHAWADHAFVELWKTISEHYKTHTAKTLIFELLNEPQYYNSEALWNKLSARTVIAIHAISPDRLIIIGAPHGSEIDGLSFLQPSIDPHLIYAFHFYEPYIVTHQGIHMGFGKYMIKSFRNLPYPSTLANQTAAIYAPTAPNPQQAQDELQSYVNTPWNSAHIAERMKIAGEWATQHHVRLLCGEFGVLRNHIDPASRYRWINDARSALDANHIGWELWDYTDLFGITALHGATSTDPVDGSVTLNDPQKSSRSFEPQALTALKLGGQ